MYDTAPAAAVHCVAAAYEAQFSEMHVYEGMGGVLASGSGIVCAL